MQNSSYAIYIYLNSRLVSFSTSLLVVSWAQYRVPCLKRIRWMNAWMLLCVCFFFFSWYLNETFFHFLLLIIFYLRLCRSFCGSDICCCCNLTCCCVFVLVNVNVSVGTSSYAYSTIIFVNLWDCHWFSQQFLSLERLPIWNCSQLTSKCRHCHTAYFVVVVFAFFYLDLYSNKISYAITTAVCAFCCVDCCFANTFPCLHFVSPIIFGCCVFFSRSIWLPYAHFFASIWQNETHEKKTGKKTTKR